MDRSPRTPLDPEALAERESGLTGRLDAGVFDARLAEALDVDRSSGEVVYALDFRRARAGAVGVSGTLRARLVARCQRCLEAFELELELAPRLFIPAAEGIQAPKGWELAEPGARPSLAELIEEELLLALPFAPHHPEGACPAGSSATAEPEPARRHPFAGLADALARGRDREKP